MELSESNIHGKNLDAENRERIAIHYEKLSKEGREPINGEIEKSGEILRYIEKINSYLNEELKSLDLNEVQLDANSIHIFPPEIFKKEFPDTAEVNGLYLTRKDSVYIEQDKSRLQVYKALLHEVVHQTSYRSVYANPETRTTSVPRVGYGSNQTTEINHEHFRGLNEAVVDSIVKEIFQKHANELIKDFHITEEEQKESVIYYNDYMDILNVIMNKIAEKNNESKKTVWDRFKKGEFTGEMMHLREIESVFGDGALRVLAALASGTKNMPFSKLIKQMQMYFNTNDAAVQEKIAKEILVERERLQYEKRRT